MPDLWSCFPIPLHNESSNRGTGQFGAACLIRAKYTTYLGSEVRPIVLLSLSRLTDERNRLKGKAGGKVSPKSPTTLEPTACNIGTQVWVRISWECVCVDALGPLFKSYNHSKVVETMCICVCDGSLWKVRPVSVGGGPLELAASNCGMVGTETLVRRAHKLRHTSVVYIHMHHHTHSATHTPLWAYELSTLMWVVVWACPLLVRTIAIGCCSWWENTSYLYYV